MSLEHATTRIDPWRVRLKTAKMKAEGLIFASKELFPQLVVDETLHQVAAVADLPGLVGPSLAMPDAHQGYGFPIGGVAATDAEGDGVVSPGGVGFDINCGVRLIATDLVAAEALTLVEELLDEIAARVPVGFDRSQAKALGKRDMDRVLANGAAWAVEQGMGTADDLLRCEEGGAYHLADPGEVDQRARERGASQVGTLGSGNHFVELQRVAEISDEAVAEAFGLWRGQLVVLVHTGSRGLGHQVCQDQLRLVGKAMSRHGLVVPDRQLACAPIRSAEGRSYLAAMAAAANFAWANRQVIQHHVLGALHEVFGQVGGRLVYDVAHNMAKLEDHVVDGRTRRLAVHRKGATRAFPAGHAAVPAPYREVGQPAFIPGSMGTSSWVVVGTERALGETWGSICHGAGRTMSRTQARREATADDLIALLRSRGVSVRAGSRKGLVEEHPEAYKDVDEVVATITGAGLARAVARLVPMGVLKG